MEQEEKFIRITDVFRTTQSSEGDGPAQQQTTLFPGVPSTSAAPTQQPTTVEDLKTTETVADGANEANEVENYRSVWEGA